MGPDCDYIVTGNVLVQEGSSLYVQNNTRLKFDTDVFMLVEGSIQVQAEREAPAVFTGHDAATWLGIRISDKSAGTSVVKNAVFESVGYDGSALRITENTMTIENIAVRSSLGVGIYASLSHPGGITHTITISDSTFTGTRNPVIVEGLGDSKIFNSRFEGNSGIFSIKRGG